MKKKGKEQTNQCKKEVVEGGARDMEQSWSQENYPSLTSNIHINPGHGVRYLKVLCGQSRAHGYLHGTNVMD